jgi:site-specific recombinase XerD
LPRTTSPVLNDALIARYLAERIRLHDLSPLTARNSRCALRGLARTTGPITVDRLTSRHVERWLESMEKLAPATRRSRFSAVRMFVRWGIRRGHLRIDPTLEVPPPRQPRSIPRALPTPHVVDLLEVCPDNRARLIVTLMVQQGLRCCEVSALQLGDVDLDGRSMRIRGKGGHERILPVCKDTRKALVAYLDEHPSSIGGTVVRSYRRPTHGLAADTISGLVSEWMNAARIKRARRDGVSAHALRHTAATDMLRNGAHVRDVQQALGHAHLATTEVYLPYVVRGLAKAMGGRSYRRRGAGRRPVA